MAALNGRMNEWPCEKSWIQPDKDEDAGADAAALSKGNRVDSGGVGGNIESSAGVSDWWKDWWARRRRD